jgi:pimeloyl-ACP methyl ester carboxylesterase
MAQPPIWRETRLGLEVAALLRDPIFRGVGVEDAGGQPVLLIPGFLAGDDSLGLMTRWLRRTGHHTSKAGIRSNVDCSQATAVRLEQRLERLAERTGRRVAIIGQSRGGHFARVLAVRRPDLVAGVVTLGSPQCDPLAVNPLVRASIFAVGLAGTIRRRGLMRASCLWGDCCTDFWDDFEAPFPKRTGYVSVYSRSDGVVDWRSCLDPAAEHVEIAASHVGMAVHPDGYRVIADALAQFRAADEAARKRKRRGRKAAAPKAAGGRARRAAGGEVAAKAA